MRPLTVLLTDLGGSGKASGLSSTNRACAVSTGKASIVVGVAKAAAAGLKVLSVALVSDGVGGGEGGQGHDGDEELLLHMSVFEDFDIECSTYGERVHVELVNLILKICV